MAKDTDSDGLQLQEGEQHIVDNGHLVAWNCDYKIEKAASGSWSSVKSGEGLVSILSSLPLRTWVAKFGTRSVASRDPGPSTCRLATSTTLLAG